MMSLQHLKASLNNSQTTVTEFLNVLFQPPQIAQFRRSCIFRTAGNIAGSFTQVSSGSGIGVSESRQISDRYELRDSLYEKSMEQITLLLKAYNDDPFLTETENIRKKGQYKTITLIERC